MVSIRGDPIPVCAYAPIDQSRKNVKFASYGDRGRPMPIARHLASTDLERCQRLKPPGAKAAGCEERRLRLTGARPARSACFDPQFAHFVNQGGARQAQPCRRTMQSAEPVGLLQYIDNVLPLGLGEHARRGCRRLLRHVLQFRQRGAQYRIG